MSYPFYKILDKGNGEREIKRIISTNYWVKEEKMKRMMFAVVGMVMVLGMVSTALAADGSVWPPVKPGLMASLSRSDGSKCAIFGITTGGVSVFCKASAGEVTEYACPGRLATLTCTPGGKTIMTSDNPATKCTKVCGGTNTWTK